ncbi:MAG: hypothetical protein JRG92_23055, partial [Deltaproteobacteria bacterium]|nr:hypothetical protein [Deltaproteobacteria bacterium]
MSSPHNNHLDETSDSTSGRSAAIEACFFGLLLVFLVAYGSLLPTLQHLIDEGTNIYAAKLIQQGLIPFRDFIYHQPPLYIYTLALLPTDHFVWGRALSLAATCGAGRVIFEIAKSLMPEGAPGALFPVALFYFAALQYYGILALPNACMVFFALLGAWWTIDRGRVVLGGAAIVVSVLFKPIAIPIIFALACALASRRDRWSDLLPFVATVGSGAVLSYVALHIGTDGAFTDLIYLQAVRYADSSVYELLKGLPMLRADLEPWTSREMNLLIHLDWLRSPDPLLALLLLPGVWVALRAGVVTRESLVLWITWLTFSVLSVIYVWDVSWPHYHVLYLPPLSLLGGLFLHVVARQSRMFAVVVVCLCITYASAGLLVNHWRQRDYTEVLALARERAPLLTFDATLNVLSRSESPCGLLDYLAQRSPAFQGDRFAH